MYYSELSKMFFFTKIFEISILYYIGTPCFITVEIKLKFHVKRADSVKILNASKKKPDKG